MSRPLKDEKALCADLSTFINVTKSYQQQQRIVAKAQQQASRQQGAAESPSPSSLEKRRGSVWIVLKGGFSSPNASPAQQEHRRRFREQLRASKRERAAVVEAAEEQYEPEQPETAETSEPTENEEGGTNVAEDDGAVAEEELAEPVAQAAAKVPGEAFLEFVQRHGATADAEGVIDQSEPTRCIVRVRCSRPLSAARQLPQPEEELVAEKPKKKAKKAAKESADPRLAKKARREAARKRRRRSVRGLHCKSTSILGSQKAVNYFKTNLLQLLKREVQPYMAKSLAAPPAVSNVPFSDAVPKETPAPVKGEEKPSAPNRSEASPEGKGKEPARAPKEAEGKKAPPASGKTKAQLKAEQSQSKPQPQSSQAASSGSAKKGGKKK